jgi:hypothetical protein
MENVKFPEVGARCIMNIGYSTIKGAQLDMFIVIAVL